MENKYELYFEGGGEMGALIRSYDWASSDLGDPNTWSLNLLNTISIMLNSRFPMFLWWGPQLIQFYNDAYRPSLGNNGKHPGALGQRGGRLLERNMAYDQATDRSGTFWRRKRLERRPAHPHLSQWPIGNAYWTFSYSKVFDKCSKTGVLVICTETTNKVNAFNELLQAKSELEFAITAAELGTWDLNPATNHFTCNERLKSWFGYLQIRSYPYRVQQR